MSLTNFLVKTYSVTSKTGVFDLPIVKGPFSRAYFLYKRFLEDPFYPILKKYPNLLGSGVVIDIGANIGYTAVLFSEFSKDDQTIYAFEPEPKNFVELKRIVRSKGLEDRVKPLCCALGEAERTCTLWQADTHHADHRIVTNTFRERYEDSETGGAEFLEVSMQSLDSFAREHNVLDKVSFVKMDVQGYEIPVLRGMREVIRQNPDLALAVEYCPKDLKSLGFEPGELTDELAHLGFAIHMYHEGELIPLDTDVLSALVAERGYCDFICIQGSLDRLMVKFQG